MNDPERGLSLLYLGLNSCDDCQLLLQSYYYALSLHLHKHKHICIYHLCAKPSEDENFPENKREYLDFISDNII